jgi:hypothetical protein
VFLGVNAEIDRRAIVVSGRHHCDTVSLPKAEYTTVEPPWPPDILACLIQSIFSSLPSALDAPVDDRRCQIVILALSGRVVLRGDHDVSGCTLSLLLASLIFAY